MPFDRDGIAVARALELSLHDIFDAGQGRARLRECIEPQTFGPRVHVADAVGQRDRTGLGRPLGLKLEAEIGDDP